MAVAEIAREVQVLAVFRQLLNAPLLGPEENFFEAGGSSLLAARLAARLRSSGVLDVPTSAIFAAPSARALVHYAASLLPADASSVATAAPEPPLAASGDVPALAAPLERGARQRAAFARLRPVPVVKVSSTDSQETR